MIPDRPAVERRILSAIDAAPARIPVLVGGCGCGRTSLLLRVRDLVGRAACQYIDVERVATTPERFLRAVTVVSPFAAAQARGPGGTAREAFAAALGLFRAARAPGDAPATFLFDEVLEFRTFESFPGLRGVLRDLLDALPQGPNRFVLSTRFVSRALRLLRAAPAQFEVIQVPPLAPSEVRAAAMTLGASDERDRDDLARAVYVLSDGRPAYVRGILDMMTAMDPRGGGDPVGALAALMAPGGALHARCRFCYELRLHRARGYGALKAILDVLAAEEPLTLTEIAQRLQRTPGSTKDYLSWLEDVDLVAARQKRYSFTDPVLRLWARIHCQPLPPTDEDVAREVQTYAMARLPRPEPAMAMAGGGDDGDRKSWGIIEID